ncbi:restriction endonuclease [Burkholderia cepacia]|uniref:Restriction endonuclease type IV Mrr domain-containing protein n=1 Tax=Burkholderia cepacia GG4 TaxID=1009846 RepID=A0A9W3K6K8_BURCE|nr:restriction endonuclease [Burkholderia cepacia]AFQ50418.1 hypothetical protein GEM_4028 [Burkholderia cepacia GG4]
MKYDKAVIAGIAGIDNWQAFEEFVKDLYAQNDSAVDVVRSYKAQGASGRNREVDVLVTFGFKPHILSLGVECKYWSNKVNGDIIDVAAAKRDDLSLDKYAVITTVGFEAGAELYAKSKGIDLFLIRPSMDDDFGYTGRVIKVRIFMHGSRPVDIRLNATIVCEPGLEKIAADLLAAKLSDVGAPDSADDFDPELNLYRYSRIEHGNGVVTFERGEHANNLLKLLLDTWRTQDGNFWDGKPSSIRQKIIFKSPTALFFLNRTVVMINEIDFQMQYLRIESELEINRGEKYPLVLENVIANAITPLSAKHTANEIKFSMGDPTPKIAVDLSKKPDDAIGREGVAITLRLTNPMGISSEDPKARIFELVGHEEGVTWRPLHPPHP